MNKELIFNGKTENEYFDLLVKTMKDKISTWDCFFDEAAVIENIHKYENEFCLLDSLIGKDDVFSELVRIMSQHPKVIEILPLLIDLRGYTNINVLTDTQDFTYRNFDFSIKKLSQNQINNVADWFMKSGVAELISKKKITSFMSYLTGLQVVRNGAMRSEKIGSTMNSIVEPYVEKACSFHGASYISQATRADIEDEWGIDIDVDLDERQFDFAINKSGFLYLIDTHFGGGSGRYFNLIEREQIDMVNFWIDQGIEFILVADGCSFESTRKALREFFDHSPALLNLQCLQDGALERILK